MTTETAKYVVQQWVFGKLDAEGRGALLECIEELWKAGFKGQEFEKLFGSTYEIDVFPGEGERVLLSIKAPGLKKVDVVYELDYDLFYSAIYAVAKKEYLGVYGPVQLLVVLATDERFRDRSRLEV